MSASHIRRLIIEQSRRAHVGHIGCALSVTDIIECIYERMLLPRVLNGPDRDRFILSKGHAALALYAVLSAKGIISEEQLNTYCADASLVGVHPEFILPGIDFSTGSLGMGLSFAAGAALAGRLQKSSRRAFALLSDGECNEGAVWEAAMFAAQHKLSNLFAFIDLNGQQAFGRTSEVLDQSNMAERWRAFGWDTHEVDGHDAAAIEKAVVACAIRDQPHVIIAHTIFGKGVSFMESQIKWHYQPLSEEEYQMALTEIDAAA